MATMATVEVQECSDCGGIFQKSLMVPGWEYLGDHARPKYRCSMCDRKAKKNPEAGKEANKMRELTDHIVEGDLPQNQLKIAVTDLPGAGGANHRYEITGLDTHGNSSEYPDEFYLDSTRHIILFQNGPIQEYGINGLTQEVLLAIVIDRLRSFQAGPFPCEANRMAMDHCENALAYLQARTKERLARGVEGTTKA